MPIAQFPLMTAQVVPYRLALVCGSLRDEAQKIQPLLSSDDGLQLCRPTPIRLLLKMQSSYGITKDYSTDPG